MTAWTPRLSATVGPRAINRPHDIALIQALLGETTLRGRVFFRNHVTGRFDQQTAEALAGFSHPIGDPGPRPRNAAERMFGRIKNFRRLATRYARLARTILAVVCLVDTARYLL